MNKRVTIDMAFTAQSMSKFVAIFHGCFCLYRGIDQKYSLSKLELYKHDFVNTRGADGSCLNDRIQEVSGYWIGHRLLNDVYQIFMLSLQFWMVLSNSFFCMHVIICMHYACVLSDFFGWLLSRFLSISHPCLTHFV